MALSAGDDEAFLIGGAELYHEGLVLADRLYLTEIDAGFDGDAFLPEIDMTQWQETSREVHISAKGLKFNYITYERTQTLIYPRAG